MPPSQAGSRGLAVRETPRLPEEVPALFWIEQIAVLRRRWRVLAASVAAGIGIALSISSLQPRLYHAKTSVEIQPVSENFLKSPAENGDAVQPPDIQTQIQIIQSAEVAGSARVRLNRVGAGVGAGVANRVTDDVARSLSVHTAGQTRIIEIEADARDPRIASDYVNGVADAYIARHLEAGEQASGLLTARLRVAIDELRTRLEAANTALQSYSRESGIILTPDQSSVTEERLRQIQDALSRAEADRVQKQARSEAVSRTGAPDLASVLNDPAIKSGQEKLADLQRQRAELSVIYTADHPKVERLDAQIESVASAIRLQIADAAGRIRSEYEESRRREAMLAESYQTQRAAVLEEGDKRGHYAVLKSEADSTRALYDTMLSRVKETGIAAAMRDTNVRVLDRALPASTPFQPRFTQAFLMGAIAGLLIGFFITHSLEEADRKVRTPGEYTATAFARRRATARVWDYNRAARRRQDLGRARRGLRLDRQTRVSASRSDVRRRYAPASEAATCGK
jgi:uncharacterized protein involved in exopolysaccharide biosynthesis